MPTLMSERAVNKMRPLGTFLCHVSVAQGSGGRPRPLRACMARRYHAVYAGRHIERAAPNWLPMAMQTFPLRDQGMDAALRRGGHFLQQRGPKLLSVLLVLLLAWLLAKFTWSI